MIKSLEKTSFDQLYEGFSKAFADYDFQLSRDELHVMLHRRGFNPGLSFGAFEGDKLIAFTFNGTGMYRGAKTAYDTGTGTTKEYRKRGLATEIFEYSIPHLKNAGISCYLLEVLQHNSKAVSVYKNLGFEVSREFNYFLQTTEDIKIDTEIPGSEFQFQQTDLSQQKLMESFHEFIPSWQNSFDAIMRSPDDFILNGAFKDTRLVGYCILEPGSGDITQIAVDKQYRRKGIASALLGEAIRQSQFPNIKVVNTETGCRSITAFMESVNLPLTGKQFEMTREL